MFKPTRRFSAFTALSMSLAIAASAVQASTATSVVTDRPYLDDGATIIPGMQERHKGPWAYPVELLIYLAKGQDSITDAPLADSPLPYGRSIADETHMFSAYSPILGD